VHFSDPLLLNCKFDSNLAWNTGANSITSYGGAIANFESSDLILINCSFAENNSKNGGAISNHNYSNCKIINCTFANNSGSTYGGVYNMIYANLDIINSIFWENSNYNLNNLGNIDIQYSRIDTEFTGIGNIDDDPLVEDLLNNDFHLTSLSPCINAGTPDTTGLNLPTYDLDISPRILDGIIDMGCYEYNPDTPPQDQGDMFLVQPRFA